MQIATKQYVVEYPSAAAAQSFASNQTLQEARLSTDTRKVATLTADQVEFARTKGARVSVNYAITIPKPPHAPIPVGVIGPTLTNTVPTHGADKLHAAGIKGSGVTVCVIDTGTEDHKDVKGRIKKFYDVIDKREEAPNDAHGHGLHCTGIVGASGNALGMAPECDFIGIKVLDDNGSGSLATVMAGVDQAIEYYNAGYKPMVISMSLGGTAGPVAEDALVKKMEEAEKLGIVCVVAGGNSGPRAGTIGTPGTAPSVITVAAADTKNTANQDDDIVAYFSSVGDPKKPELGQANKPNILANGWKVNSLGKGNTYATMSGTSMATPAVAGGVALLMNVAKNLEARGALAVETSAINYDKLLYDSANDHANIPATKEGAGEMRIDKAADLLVAQYGKPNLSMVDRQRVHELRAFGTQTAPKWKESAKLNRLAARREWQQASTMDKFRASKGKSLARRFVALLRDIGEAPVLTVAALKDVADAVRCDAAAE